MTKGGIQKHTIGQFYATEFNKAFYSETGLRMGLHKKLAFELAHNNINILITENEFYRIIIMLAKRT